MSLFATHPRISGDYLLVRSVFTGYGGEASRWVSAGCAVGTGGLRSVMHGHCLRCGLCVVACGAGRCGLQGLPLANRGNTWETLSRAGVTAVESATGEEERVARATRVCQDSHPKNAPSTSTAGHAAVAQQALSQRRAGS